MEQEVTHYTTSEVAELFQVDSSAVRRWVLKGKLTPTLTTLGGHRRFERSVIDALVASIRQDDKAS